ncbi:MAG: hypothetical protein M1823_005873 [Watsoniomyces obsoletus]|nr:MAG: hypothetical protein M1823_005873 [Watsoniomyces obsoletus]
MAEGREEVASSAETASPDVVSSPTVMVSPSETSAPEPAAAMLDTQMSAEGPLVQQISESPMQVSPRTSSLLSNQYQSMVDVPLNAELEQVREEEDETSRQQSLEGTAASLLSPSSMASTGLNSEIHSDRDQASGRSKRSSSGTSMSSQTGGVDWDELGRSEEQEARQDGSEESTAMLLARLEQANDALATNPKSGLPNARAIRSPQFQRQSRPPSLQQLKSLLTAPTPPSLRYSMLPAPPPMTDLEFYAALVADYPRTAQCLPTLLSKKIRSGVPPPLRGVVWVSMAGARDQSLEMQFEKLLGEHSPFESIIGKDIGRSFPGIDMFKEPGGEGQRKLGNVLKCFSLYDQKIGYCQGLGFLVGPLLMHMGDREAFCVLVRLMEHYDLRSCFLPDLAGLHLRIYQFRHLLAQHLPELAAHLEKLNINPAYVSQWFLSFFAVTCPLPMLLRIYDVIFAEGASETLMRVALSLMRRNQAKLMAYTELEDVMHLLLSRAVWDAYGYDADAFVNDFVELISVVSHESLLALEASFKEAKKEGAHAKLPSLPDLQAATSRFLGRFWAGSSTPAKSTSLSPGVASSRPTSLLRRSPSKQSMASTLNSIEVASESDVSSPSTSTEITAMSRQASAEGVAMKSPLIPAPPPSNPVPQKPIRSAEKDLHGQIEDLLTALSEMQKSQAQLGAELQRERQAREKDSEAVHQLVAHLRGDGEAPKSDPSSPDADNELEELTALIDRLPHLLDVVEEQFARAAVDQLAPKPDPEIELNQLRVQFNLELSKTRALTMRLDEQGLEISNLEDQLKEARSRVKEGHKERQRLESVVQDLRAKRPSDSASSHGSTASVDAGNRRSSTHTHSGLREFRLNKASHSASSSQPAPTFSRRTSSLSAQAVLTAPTTSSSPPTPPVPANEEALLLELVNSKTAEASAKQEVEELRAKLESLKKLIAASDQPSGETGGPRTLLNSLLHSAPAKKAEVPSTAPAPTPAPTTTGGGFWGAWGKRAAPNTNNTTE